MNGRIYLLYFKRGQSAIQTDTYVCCINGNRVANKFSLFQTFFFGFVNCVVVDRRLQAQKEDDIPSFGIVLMCGAVACIGKLWNRSDWIRLFGDLRALEPIFLCSVCSRLKGKTRDKKRKLERGRDRKYMNEKEDAVRIFIQSRSFDLM